MCITKKYDQIFQKKNKLYFFNDHIMKRKVKTLFSSHHQSDKSNKKRVDWYKF